jgi:hypothetical protein
MLPLALSLALLSPAVAAAETQRPRSVITRGDGFLRASVNAVSGLPSLRRRQFEAPVANHRLGTQYAIDVDIGTPAQTLTLILDTGSPDLWVNPSCPTANLPSECRKYPQFDYKKSTSLKTTGFADVLSYGKGNVTIEYVTDTVAIGNVKITEQIFGIGLESHDIPLGILGLSPAISQNDPDLYPFVLDTMKAQGVIKSRAFSLDLRGVTEPEGAVIFGGLDTGKFVGTLEKLPMVDPSKIKSGADRYWIVLTGVGMTFPDGTSERSGDIEVPVFPDSGGTLSRLPTPIFQAFGETFPTAQFDPNSGFYIVDCDVASQPGSVDFYFNNKHIAVTYADFIWQVSGSCVLGVLPDDDEPVLGDSFLRAAYVVHDQDNRNLFLAQAANCGSNIVSIGTGSNAVPSVTGDCTAAPSATKVGFGFDATATRNPTNIFTGSSPDATDVGPGPAGGRSGTATGRLPGATGQSAAGRNTLSNGFAALAAVAASFLML